MKKQSNRNAVITGTICLLVICFVVTLMVAGTRFIFKDKIAEQEWLAQQESMNQILKAETYEELSASNDEQVYLALDDQGAAVGYIFVTEAYGYGSMIRVMSGISDGKVVGVTILDCSNETPGLGQNVASDSFREQFSGLTAAPTVTKSSAKSAAEIEAITGATKSSKAVAEAVSSALKLYEDYAKAGEL